MPRPQPSHRQPDLFALKDPPVPIACVKPFVKRQKNDMADAEAITEAAARPTMRS